MTILEYISVNVERLLTSEEVLTERDRQSPEQRLAFMTTFAIYVEWLVLRVCRPLFSAKDFSAITSEIRRRLTTQDWFSPDLYTEILEAVNLRLNIMKPGRRTGVLLPMVHAVEGANSVGHNIQHSKDMMFITYTIAAWEFMATQIPKVRGAKHAQTH